LEQSISSEESADEMPALYMQTFTRFPPLPELRAVSHDVDALVGKQNKRLRSALAAAFDSFGASY
jgi:hypothetical protein